MAGEVSAEISTVGFQNSAPGSGDIPTTIKGAGKVDFLEGAVAYLILVGIVRQGSLNTDHVVMVVAGHAGQVQ